MKEKSPEVFKNEDEFQKFLKKVEKYKIVPLKYLSSKDEILLNINNREFHIFDIAILEDHNLSSFQLRLMLDILTWNFSSLGYCSFDMLANWGDYREDRHPELRNEFQIEKELFELEKKGYIEIIIE